jgi:hypothetical protein
VGRHPVERRQLQRAQAKHVLELGRDAGPAAGDQRRETLIERGLAAQHTGGELVRQPAIGLAEPLDGAVEGQIEGPAGADLRQHGVRGLPGRQALGGHGQASPRLHEGRVVVPSQ